ncbi:carboxylesterase [Colletotrichum godetiae]|uniref:Carboxylesterase n=1 Tax=Colletotrichum godetiae TaxID=1209918 RepID=A0AAJ0EVP7_9PEZI|nr:carboxylesterase [Colletotrichum godetiae]KAK1689004.1 carboxylesterase [Colletotrichum godetiae]
MALAGWLAVTSASTVDRSPIVDLGYAAHQASHNQKAGYYNFSNIQYANAPRFSAPTPIKSVNRSVNLGQRASICLAAFPAWYGISSLYQSGQLSLDEVNSTFAESQSVTPNSGSESIGRYLNAADTTVTEDCLVLDVVVPDRLWGKSRNHSHSAAPVIVWLHGGSYVLGHKNFAAHPAGLIAKAQEDGSDGVIHVALHYRLGLFGWMSGPAFIEQGGVANLGLRDQRLALEWIWENIHLFSGDPDNVTVLGEFTGGGSILHQLTASSSSSGAPFKRAILKSPGFEPMEGPAKQNLQYRRVLEWASYFSNSTVSSLDDLKQLPFDVIIAKSYWGAWVPWGPAVDNDFVEDLPGVLLSNGKFDKSVEIPTSHNSDEGFIFTSPLIKTDHEYVSGFLQNLLPDASDDVIDYIKTELYPAVYDGTHPWKTPLERTSATIAEAWFICNNQFLNEALGGDAHNYLFDVPPGYHGTDIAHTFFNGEATTLQAYVTIFAKTGGPNAVNIPWVPVYGQNATYVSIYDELPVSNNDAMDRCSWWQRAVYRS